MIHLILLLIGTIYCTEDVVLEFSRFTKKFNREYLTIKETMERFEIFSENYKYIQEHNNKNLGFTLKVNQFSDLTPEELNSMFQGIDVEEAFCETKSLPGEPDLIDWREKEVITPVRNEESCNSGWAMSVAGALESYHAIHHKEVTEVSVQELIDCSSKDDDGCKNGSPDSAFEYVSKEGISTEESYPYVGRKEECQINDKKLEFPSCFTVPPKNTKELLLALVENPVVIAVKANNRNFLNYNSGVLRSSCGTSNDKLDHYVLLVGAGVKDNYPCWIIKNSWGTEWGEKGYAFILREEKEKKYENNCGITEYSLYPT